MKGSIVLVVIGATMAATAVPDHVAFNDLTPRQQRSFSISDVPIIGSLFGGEEEEPEIPHLGSHPLWKVHRYHGISLHPIDIPKAEFLHSPPVAPTLEEEAPSIVNVPEHFAPEDHDVLLPNEYDPHYVPARGPYPPSQPSGPYPPSQPLGPYPPSQPSGPYPPSQLSGPYPPSQPSGPYPSAPAHEVHSNIEVEHPHPPSDYSHIIDALTSLGGGHGDDTEGLSGLLNILPSDMVYRLHDYMSTPEGRERTSTLLGIASNAQKLKSGAARSLAGMFQRLFGGAGGSTDVALHSGTYTNVPEPYPAHQGLLTRLGALGTGVLGHPIPDLPEVPELPNIPGLGPLPPAPHLPHINLPATSHFNSKGTSGKYVSINLPQPEETSHTYIVPEEHHGHSYEPRESYGALAQAAPQYSYGAPSAPQNSYGEPTPDAPQNSYGAPAAPQNSYGEPAPDAPQQSYEAPAPAAPQNSYGAPEPAAPHNSYEVPAPKNSYGTPIQSYAAPVQAPQAPSQSFSPPAPVYSPPSQTYAVPSQTYQIPSTSYGTPVGPTYPYHQGAHPAMTFQPLHGFDSSLAASENQENHVEAKEEEDEEEDAEEVTTPPPVTPRTTKLHRVRNHERENLLRGHARPFKPSLKDKSQHYNDEDLESQPDE